MIGLKMIGLKIIVNREFIALVIQKNLADINIGFYDLRNVGSFLTQFDQGCAEILCFPGIGVAICLNYFPI